MGILAKRKADDTLADKEAEASGDLSARTTVIPWNDALLESFRRSKMGMINFTRCGCLPQAVCVISYTLHNVLRAPMSLCPFPVQKAEVQEWQTLRSMG